MTFADLILTLLSINIILSSIFIILSINPIHALLFLIFCFINGCGILLIYQVEFISLLFIIIYVGAIAVLFLFAIMLLNLKKIEFNEYIIKYVPLAFIFLIILYLEISNFIYTQQTNILISNYITENNNYFIWINHIYNNSNIKTLGQLLYINEYYIYFIIISIVLLIAMIGALVLTLREEARIPKKQHIYTQVNRMKNIRLINNN